MEPEHLFIPALLLLFLLWKYQFPFRLANALNSLGFYLHKRNFNRTALILYKLAHFLKKHDYVILNNIGCTLRDLGKPREAKKYLEKSLALRPDYFHAKNMLGNIYIESGDMAKGIGLLEDNIEKHPDFGISYYTVAEYYFNLGEKELAGEYLEGYFACLSRVGTDGSMDSSLQNRAKVLRYYLTVQPENGEEL